MMLTCLPTNLPRYSESAIRTLSYLATLQNESVLKRERERFVIGSGVHAKKESECIEKGSVFVCK